MSEPTSRGWPWDHVGWAEPAEGLPTRPRVGEDTAVIVPGGPLIGRVRVPGDKSISHRALLLATLAPGRSVLRGLSDGDDVRRTALAMVAVGADIGGDVGGGAGSDHQPAAGITAVAVKGGRARLHEPLMPIDVGNSGTGIRLLAGWLAGFGWLSVLHGDRYVARRPMARVTDPLRLMGASVDGREHGRLPPLVIRGGDLRGIDYTLPVASSQVKSAVLMAGLAADGTTTVREPVPLRAHTEEMLAAAGADVEVSGDGRVISVRRSAVRPRDIDVPGDPSQAAYWVVAGCVVPGSDITVEGVYVGRARAGFLEVLGRMGAHLEVSMTDATTADIRARHADLRATVVEGAEVAGLIDEIPVLAVAAACAEGVTEFRDAGELRVKETDRVATVTAALRALGAAVEPRADGLSVRGGGRRQGGGRSPGDGQAHRGGRLQGGEVDSAGDHRIAMAGAIAALTADGPTRVRGWEAVATSYPAFLQHLRALQGDAPS